MISAMHYYNISPYMFNRKTVRKGSYTNTSKTNPYAKGDLTYFLNKSLNDNIKAYVTDVSSNVNNLKNITKLIYQKLYDNTSMENLKGSFEKFVTGYNRFVGFLKKNTGNSKGFEKLLDDTENIINDNKEVLKEVGIDVSKEGFLDIKNLENIDYKQVDSTKAQSFYQGFYEKLCEFMKQPLSNHMNFKDFSYYFTYAGDYNTNKSFKLIEQGLLVDICL